jgi:hypothetical protein
MQKNIFGAVFSYFFFLGKFHVEYALDLNFSTGCNASNEQMICLV